MGWFRRERVTWTERAVWAGLVLGSVAPLLLQPAPRPWRAPTWTRSTGGDVDAALDLTSTDFVLRPLGGRALDPFLAWAAAERPAELARVWARGEPLQRADAAPVLVELLEAWRAEGKPGPERKPVAERREGRQP